MAFIDTISEDQADGELAAIYASDRARQGYVANYSKAFSHRPLVMRAWEKLNGSIKAEMDLRRYELATLAAARGLRSSYCALAHGSVLTEKHFLSADQVRDAAVDPRTADLDPLDTAIMDLAGKVVTDATAITAEDVATLRHLGCTDAEILDVILAAAARCFFSKVLDAAGVQPDVAYRSLDPDFRDALTVGRPIADG